jgi:hypothetical protein
MKPSSIVALSRAQSGVSDQKPFAEGANMEVSEMNEMIERIRKSKEKSDSEDHKTGFEAGSKWAKEEAEWTDLKALDQRFRDSDNLDLVRTWSDHDDYEAAASVVEVLDREQPGRERVEECWACLMNTSPAFFELSSITDVFVSSWIEGALEVYDAVKDKVYRS